MAKIERALAQDWLVTYVRDHVLDTLAPAERMQFRMVSGQGSDAVAAWAEVTLPKYATVWRRLKGAERQRRYRAVPSMQKWMTNWNAAERTLRRDLTALLRRHHHELGVPPKATPAEVLSAALYLLEDELDARAPTLSGVFVEKPARPPRAAESMKSEENRPDTGITEIR